MTAQSAIFAPFFAMMFLTVVVWVYMYVRRIAFITGRQLNSQDLAVPLWPRRYQSTRLTGVNA